jgi:ketosteroid isomerase-like protein
VTDVRRKCPQVAERTAPMNNDVKEISELGKRWVAAELAGDTDTMDFLARRDFLLVGPLGFILDKAQWLERYSSGALVTSALDWRDTTVRVFGDCAIVIGVHDQEAAYRGQPNNGQFRATHILTREDGGWQFVGMHLSPIAAPRAPQPGG